LFLFSFLFLFAFSFAEIDFSNPVLINGRKVCPWYRTKWEKVLCSPFMKDHYSKNTLEDLVLNQRKSLSEEICVKSGKLAEEKKPVVGKDGWLWGKEEKKKRKKKKVVVIPCKLKNRSGVTSCDDNYGENTLEEIVIQKKENSICLSNNK